MPSIWDDEPSNQSAGAAPQTPLVPSEDPLLVNPQDPPQRRTEQPSRSRQDDLDTEIRLPPRIRTKFGGGLRTAGDAFEVCQALFEEQLDLAALQKPFPNVPITGDSSARSAFQLLLTDAQQRQLFLKTASNKHSWPRLRALVGAPPYHFLLPDDAAVLNASGFARGRVNMTYDAVGKVANSGQFGPGQLVDEHTREYRVAPRKLEPTDPLPGPDYFRNASKDLVLQVRVKRHTTVEKRRLLHSQFKKQLLFPQPGETITLQESARLMSARGLRAPSRTQLRVKALWPRSQGGSTAAVLVGI